MLTFRNARRAIAMTAATVALAGGTALGAAGSASATVNNCNSQSSNYGSGYTVCAYGGNTVYWSVAAGSTDERFYIYAEDDCGHTYYGFNWNDVTQSGYNNAHWQFQCNVSWAELWPTESGSQSGPTASI